jgi:nickel/cobalt transporter regulator
MKFSQFATRAALGAIAGALTLSAVPASARPARGEGSDPRAVTQDSAPPSRSAAIERAQQRNEARQSQGAPQQAQRPLEGQRQQWQGAQRPQPQPQPQQVQQAQVQRQQWQGRQDQARQQWQGRQEQQQQAQRQQWQGRQDQNRQDWQRRQQQGQQEQRRDWQNQQGRNRTYTDPNRSQNYRGNDRYRGDNNNWQNDRRGDYRDGNRQRWDRTWRNNNRYDWQRYRNTNRTVFHLGTYYSPYRDYSYRRLGVGIVLDQLFYGSNYWINDPWQYRLPDVYGPYRWVRYYDDALLVDIYSGEVVDVIYDFFW